MKKIQSTQPPRGLSPKKCEFVSNDFIAFLSNSMKIDPKMEIWFRFTLRKLRSTTTKQQAENRPPPHNGH